MAFFATETAVTDPMSHLPLTHNKNLKHSLTVLALMIM